MRKPFALIGALVFSLFMLSSCLTVEKKIYSFQFTGENSGILTIKYYNIMSIMDDTVNIAASDFDELITSYIDGDMIEQDYPMALLVEKKLYEDDGVLSAEIVLEFSNLEAAGLYQHNGSGPYMFCLNCSLDTETFEFSNGSYGGDMMPVVFWEEELPVLNLNTSITFPDETCVSLLPNYLEWK